MIWHIFKKDLRLLWPMAAIVAAVHLLNASLLAFGSKFPRFFMGPMSDYAWVSNGVLPAISLLGLSILVIAVIQQEPLPGTTQDWLTRPVPRNQLLGAKLLFVLLVGLGPILFADLLMGSAEHLRAIDVVEASLTRSAVLFCLVALPAVIVGAVTRSLTGALLFALVIVVAWVVESIVLAASTLQPPLLNSGFAWTALLMLIVMNLIALTVMWFLQLRWRSTNRVRWILTAYGCLAPALVWLPVGTAFRIQQTVARPAVPTISPELDSSQPITYSLGQALMSGALRVHPTFATVAVPVILSKPAESEVWQIDHVHFHTVGGALDQDQPASSFAYLYPGRRQGSPPAGSAGRLVMSVPIGLFESARDRHLAIEATLFLTTFRLSAKKSMLALHDGTLDEFSRCRERRSRFGGVTECVSTRAVGTCMKTEDPSRSAPTVPFNAFMCRQTSYAPWPLPLWRDPYYSTIVGGPFSMGNVQLDVESTSAERAMASENRIVSNYVPDAHFTRSIVFSLDGAAEGPLQERDKPVDGVGAAARFSAPTAMAMDRHGNLYIAEFDSVIRKVTPAGEVTTLAGLAGQNGRDDGPGADARFNQPRGIAVDAADNVYVADTGNQLIRKITPSGIVSTVAAGTESAAAKDRVALRQPADMVSASDGTIYVMDHNDAHKAVLLKISPNGAVSKIAGPDTE